MKLTAASLKAMEVIDDVISEPLGGAHRDHAEVAANLERYVVRTLRELQRIQIQQLLEDRYRRWRRMGKCLHGEALPVAGAGQHDGRGGDSNLQ